MNEISDKQIVLELTKLYFEENKHTSAGKISAVFNKIAKDIEPALKELDKKNQTKNKATTQLTFKQPGREL